MAKKWDHSTLLSVFYDPHQANQIVHSRVPRNREVKEVHLMAENFRANNKPQTIASLGCPHFSFSRSPRMRIHVTVLYCTSIELYYAYTMHIDWLMY